MPPRAHDRHRTDLSQHTGRGANVRFGSLADISRVRLRLTTESLLGAIWWELNQKSAGETTFRVCRQCGNPFEAGPGGDARADATFCRHECSALLHSLRRSKGAELCAALAINDSALKDHGNCDDAGR